jgi:hypothetical protein
MLLALLTVPVHPASFAGYVPRVEFGARLEPHNRIILGAGQDADGFDSYRRLFDDQHQPLLFMTYVGLCKPVAAITAWGTQVQYELARLAPYRMVPQVGLNLTGGKDDGSGEDAAIAAGRYDMQIAAFADAVSSLKRPVFLRIGYEFEGSWNNYHPSSFVQAWHRITKGLRDRGVPFATVWCAAGASAGWLPPEQLMKFYPGDDWVDWWGVDIFSEDEFTRPQLKAFLDAARLHQKPVMIGESTPRYVGVLSGAQSWARWFEPLLRLLQQRPEIKAVCYINWEWKEWSERLGYPWQDWGDARIQRNEVVRDLWVKSLADPIYLHATGDKSIPLPEVRTVEVRL